MSILALDIGGTRVKAGLVSDDHVEQVRILDAPERLDADGLRELLGAVAVGRACEAAGIAVPGAVRDGVVASLPGKLEGLEGLDVAAVAGDVLGCRTLVTNDALAFAAGEAVAGAGKGRARVLVVTIGTGVGTALVRDGVPDPDTIYGGFIPIAGTSVGPLDSNGRPGTIEALCRADRITGGAFPDAEQTYVAFARGDEAARDAIDSYRRDLARAVTALASAHAPDVVVLGGGPMTQDNPVTPGLQDLVNDALYGDMHVEVAVAALGDVAALVGVAHLAVRA